MKFQYFHIIHDSYSKSGKTKIFEILKNDNSAILRGEATLGFIKWFAPWRQYCFYPAEYTVFSKGCLEDLQTALAKINSEKRKQK